MRRPAATVLAGALAALACAAPRPQPDAPAVRAPLPASAPPAAAAPRAPAVRRGMAAAEVRATLGDPPRVERVDSAAAPGARYERWLYAGDRQVVLLDGVVVDVLP